MKLKQRKLSQLLLLCGLAWGIYYSHKLVLNSKQAYLSAYRIYVETQAVAIKYTNLSQQRRLHQKDPTAFKTELLAAINSIHCNPGNRCQLTNTSYGILCRIPLISSPELNTLLGQLTQGQHCMILKAKLQRTELEGLLSTELWLA